MKTFALSLMMVSSLCAIDPVRLFRTFNKDRAVEFKWNSPKKKGTLAGFEIRRSECGFPSTVFEGELVFRGGGRYLYDVDADRDLDNGKTYYYAIFTLATNGDVSTPVFATGTPVTKNPANHVDNGGFSDGISDWTLSSGANYTIENSSLPGFPYCLRLKMNGINPTYVTQKISGLKARKMYTLAVATFASSENLAPTLNINGAIQQQQEYFCCPLQQGFGPLSKSFIDGETTGYWREERFVFWTGDTNDPTNPFDGSVDLLLAAWTGGSPNDYVEFSNVRLIKRVLPMPENSYSSAHPLTIPNELAHQPLQGENLVLNSSLSGNTDQIPNWAFGSAEQAVEGNENVIQLNPSSSQIAYAQQSSPFFLTPGGAGHTLRCKAKVSAAGKVASVTVYTADGVFASTSLVAATDWEEITINIQNSKWLQPIIYVEADNSQGNNWTAQFKDFVLEATGNEWLAIPNPNPPFQFDEKEWTFENGLCSENWIVSTNLNSQVENVSISENGNLKITAYGNQAPAEKQKAAALVATRDYFPSGRYDFWVKVGPVLDSSGNAVPGVSPIGAAFACFPFHFASYVDGEPRWYDEPSPIRNSEIDWEMPADNPPGNQDPNSPFCPIISWENVRCNSWGGQRGGESGFIEMHKTYPNSINMADGQFHQLTIVWNSGGERGNGTRVNGYIEWYIDTGDDLQEEMLVGRWEGNAWGFDNVPYKASRIWFGSWFPKGPYGPDTCMVDSWAGTPNWYKAEFEVEKVRFTPQAKKPWKNRDRYVAESNPNNSVWPPDQYP